MAKGTMTLNPIRSHGLLMSKVGLAGILITTLAFTETEGLVNGKYPYLIYSLCLSMSPKMVIALDEKLETQSVQVMVGQAVDTVGMSGNPRPITGFQIQNTPVLINEGERCELSNDDVHCETDVLEDVLIVSKKEVDARA